MTKCKKDVPHTAEDKEDRIIIARARRRAQELRELREHVERTRRAERGSRA